MLEEPYQVLFEDDYASGYPQLRYNRCLPCKCPFCGVWSHQIIKDKDGKALVKCPLCDKIFSAKKYQSQSHAIHRLTDCLRNYRFRTSGSASE